MRVDPTKFISLRASFQEAKGDHIVFEEKLIQRSFSTKVSRETVITIDILARRSPPEQVLHVVGTDCVLCIGSGKNAKGQIWISDWLKPIIITFSKVGADAKLTLWNAIADRIGGPMIDQGSNFGLRLSEEISGQKWKLEFSQSLNKPPDFSVLVLRLTKENRNDF